MNLVLVGIALSLTTSVFAKEVEFGDVWSEIRIKSSAKKAADSALSASAEAKNRSARHWLPQVYLNAKSFQTNSSTTAFVGILQQRALNQQDFNPSSLNQPGNNSFNQYALGADFALYEGGASSSSHNLYSQLYLAKEHERDQVVVDQYAEIAKTYGSLAYVQNQLKKIKEIKIYLEQVLRNYQLGSKSNPVGYSGLLGLKSVENRLKGLEQDFAARLEAYHSELFRLGYQDESNWTPKSEDILSFETKYLNTENREEVSYSAQALKSKALAASEVIDLEKSKLRPRIGLFFETDGFAGSRDSASDYVAGVYLSWNLFSYRDYGSENEAAFNAAAASQYAIATVEKEQAEIESMRRIATGLESNIRLMRQSEDLLSEQSQVAERLFRSGSIQALQLVEVIARRADLISSQTDVGLALLQTKSQMITKTKFQIEK